MPTITKSGAGASAALNGWHVETNVWNPETLVYGTDYTTSVTYNPNNLADHTVWNWKFPAATATNYYDVHAYEEIMYGGSPWWDAATNAEPMAVFPLSVANLASLNINYDVGITGNTDGYNVSFELWLESSNGSGSANLTNECMVWFHHGSMTAGGSPLATYTAGTYSGSIYGSANWSSGWNYSAFMNSTDALSGSFDLVPYLAKLKSLGIIKGNEYIYGLEFGTEVETGTGSWTVNKLEYDIQTNDGVTTVVGGNTGTAGADRIAGSNDSDTLTGLAGDDQLVGFDGNDVLRGGAGANSLDGGAGTDTVALAGKPADYFVTTSGGTTTVIGTGETDTLTAVEQAAFDGSGQTLTLAQFQAQSMSALSVLNYIASYGDLIRAFSDNTSWGASHYFNNGLAEGRTISFNPLNYIASYGDLIGAFGDNQTWGVEHYIRNGFGEGRTVTFNPLNYIASYSDLIAAFGDNQTWGAEHYIRNGYAEGRKITFDPLAYLCSYGDLIQAFGDNQTWGAEHYIKNGFGEGRKITFDPLAYICSYSDLIRAFGDNRTWGEEHYIRNGYAEGRTVTFNALNYIASYGDLIQAFGDNVTWGEEHYIKNGYGEGRKISFDPVAYLINNTDLGRCGFTATDVTEHYIKNGYWEHRTANGSFGSEQTNHDLTLGGSVSDTIDTSGDKDWFAVNLNQGQTYTFTLSGADGAGGTLADPFLTIYDAHGIMLTYADKAPIRFTALSSETIYLVASANDAGTGSYKLFGAPGG